MKSGAPDSARPYRQIEPMHLLILSATALPNKMAHPIQILKSAEALARHEGVRATILCVSLTRPAPEVWRQYGIVPRGNLELRGLIPPALFKFFKLQPHILPERHFLFRWAHWRMKRALREAAREGETVVYTRNENMMKLMADEAGKLGVPVFIELHWLKYVDRFRYFLKKHQKREGRSPALGVCREKLKKMMDVEQADLSRAAGILCLTDGIRRRIERWNLNVPMTVLPSGVDTEIFKPNEKIPASVDAVYCGSLQAWKGLDLLLGAMALLPGATLEIVGGGTRNDRDRVKGLIGNLGLGERVTLIGHVPHEQVAERIARGRVCVFPSPRSGFVEARRFTSPLKLLEYAACKKPIVASDLPSVREVFTQHANAMLVEPDNPASLAKGIDLVLRNAELADYLGTTAMELSRQFNYHVRAEKILQFIKQKGE